MEVKIDKLEFKQTGIIDFKKSLKLKSQKVTTISQYKHSHLAVATTTFGYLILLNLAKGEATSATRVHKGSLVTNLGNISSACFLENYDMFATSSGSFTRNHDNSINVYRVFQAMNELYVRKVHSMNNAHGK